MSKTPNYIQLLAFLNYYDDDGGDDYYYINIHKHCNLGV